MPALKTRRRTAHSIIALSAIAAVAAGVAAPAAEAATVKPAPGKTSTEKPVGDVGSSGRMSVNSQASKSLVTNNATTSESNSAPNTYESTMGAVDASSPWQDIRALQYLLLANGIKTKTWETSWGKDTSAAVLAYQRKLNIAGSGRAIASTMTRLATTTVPGQNTYRTYAVQTLLKKHGYRFGTGTAAPMNTVFDANTVELVKSFQTNHGLADAATIGPVNWSTMFAKRTVGPAYAIEQARTGNAQWTNCGPASAVSLLLSKNITPNKWSGNRADSAGAVMDFRNVAMGVPDTAERNKKGTSSREMRTGFAKYGLGRVTWDTFDAGLADVRAGNPIILSGNGNAMPWATRTRGPVSHWVTVSGYDGKNYLVVDPISAVGSTVLHRISKDQLNTYTATDNGVTDASKVYASVLVH